MTEATPQWPVRQEQDYRDALQRNVMDGRNELYFIKIGEIFFPDEDVLLALPGSAGDDTEALIVTTHRLLKVQFLAFRRHLRFEIPASLVAGAEYRRGFFTRLKIWRRDSRHPFKFVVGNADDTERFVHQLNHLIATGRLPEGV